MRKRPLPKPRPCLVAALELLGLDDAQMPTGRARRALGEVERFGDFMGATFPEGHLSLSGHRVLYVLPVQQKGASLFLSVMQLALLQNNLVALGVLVRGALVSGEAVTGEDMVFGAGIAEAERLRDEVTVAPRVIIDPEMLRRMEVTGELRHPRHAVAEELGYLSKVLRQDADGVWRIDYLSVSGLHEQELSLILKPLRAHRDLVVQKLESASHLDRSSHSWAWLWSYHNLIIDEVKDKWPWDELEIEALRIPASSPVVYKFPPPRKPPADP